VNRSVRLGMTVLIALVVCVPVLALGPEDFQRQKLPPQPESGMYDKRDLQSDPGPEVVPLPRVPTKPILIEPGGDSSSSALRAPGPGTMPFAGVTALTSGAGGGGVADPIVGAESAMRKVIRRLD